ncbi:MAG: isochorismatase family protein [Nitrospinota bacterium]|nr:MAG: isochorismatase family protein [Nitrospinota bacterium]
MEHRHPLLLERAHTGLVIIDMQERLLAVMPTEERSRVLQNILLLITLSRELHLPLFLTEQYPKGLGRTIAEITDAVSGVSPLEKLTFSACQTPAFLETLQAAQVHNLILTGIETHICVLQTALDLCHLGYQVHIPADATCSRQRDNWQIGLRLMERGGGIVTSTEAVIFQLLQQAGTAEFKAMLPHLR